MINFIEMTFANFIGCSLALLVFYVFLFQWVKNEDDI